MKKRTRWIAVLLMMVLICCASCAQKGGAGEQAFIGEYVEEFGEEKNPIAQVPSKPLQEHLQEQKNDSMVQKVEQNCDLEMKIITVGDLEGVLDYDVYYHHIENFYIEVDGETIELRQALKKDPKILDALYAEWKKDHGSIGMYNDGGTVTYPYENYYAIKCNFSLSLPDNVYVRDLILADTKNAAHQAWDKLKNQKELEYMPRVVYSDSKTPVCLTDGALGEHFDYEIYYYGIDFFMIELDGKIIKFRTAIEQDPTVLDRLYDQWAQQFGSGVLAYNGGSAGYNFGEYRIYKLNAMEWNDIDKKNETRKDLIIASPDISLDEAKDATK